MGVAPDQCEQVARLIGIKITLNEFIAYQKLAELKKDHLITVSNIKLIFEINLTNI